MCDIPYHEAIGLLMYAALRIHPNIAFAVQTISCFLMKPGLMHWEAVKWIFRYLKGTMELWLSYGIQRMDLTGYADADGSMAKDRHAISGYAFLIHCGAVSWSAKQQEIIVLSTTEAEYVAIIHAVKEALWLHALLSQIFCPQLNHSFLGQQICNRSISTYILILFDTLWKVDPSVLSTALLMTGLPTHSPRPFHLRKRSTLLHNLVSHHLEGECWNPARCRATISV